VALELRGCPNIESLAPLVLLPSLSELAVEDSVPLLDVWNLCNAPALGRLGLARRLRQFSWDPREPTEVIELAHRLAARLGFAVVERWHEREAWVELDAAGRRTRERKGARGEPQLRLEVRERGERGTPPDPPTDFDSCEVRLRGAPGGFELSLSAKRPFFETRSVHHDHWDTLEVRALGAPARVLGITLDPTL